MKESRGIRNNNPGNIDRTKPKRTPWQGAVPEHALTDTRFEQFRTPEWGIRALARVLITYQDKHGLRTIHDIINRWAPPIENDTHSYVMSVARACKVGAHENVNLQEFDIMLPLVKAIIQHENGTQPYSTAQLTAGLRLAGVVPETAEEVKPLLQTRTVAGAAVSTAAGLASVGSELQDAGSIASTLSNPGTIFAIVCGVVIILGAALTIYGKIKSRRRGIG